MKKAHLTCKDCNITYAAEDVFRCERCAGPLDLLYDGHGIDPKGKTAMQRYAGFFPFGEDEICTLGEGLTPLVNLQPLAEKLGLASLWVKNESANPTWSFKDRGTASCVSHAKALGFKKIGTVSSGNMAASVAAYGAFASMDMKILVKGNVADEKLYPVAIYGATVLRVSGNYDDVYASSLKLGKQQGIYFMNSDAPFRVAGSRTIAYEIAEDLEFDVPDWIIIPTSAGGNFRGIVSGFWDLKRFGYTTKMPKFLCAQASGCAPIATAFENGNATISRFQNAHTIAHAIENPFPPSGNRVLKLLRDNDWSAVSVSDERIINAQAEMAQNGLFGQPASCVPLAALRTALDRGIINPLEKVALIMTGSGLKYTAAFEKHPLHWIDCDITQLEELLSK